MNKRRRIYRGFNKRHHAQKVKVVTTILCLCVIGGYGYTKVKDTKILNNFKQISIPFEKISFLNKFKQNKSKVITSKDLENELSNISKENEKTVETSSDKKIKKDEDKKVQEKKEDVKLAIIDGWSVYNIQAASLDKADDTKLEKIEEKLTDNKIPFSVVEMDKLKKVQTYSNFDKEVTRKNLDEVRKIFPDAFVAEMKVPTLSLEYTNKYKEVDSISKELNKLITSFKEESEFWIKNTKKADLEKYNQILTNRKKIVESVSEYTEKIQYSEMNLFKENLVRYTKDVNEKIDKASKSANEEQYYISQSLLTSSMQGYFSFIESIKKV